MNLINDCNLPDSRLEPSPGTLYLVGTPIGNLGDLSPRAKSLLRKVTIVACEDTRRSGQLLKIIESKAPLISYHKHNFKSRSPQILEILKTKGSVALISDAGLPGISDPGEELVKTAKLHNHEVICIPGPCAATTALVISGLNTQRFCFEGFLPKKQSERSKRMQDISQEKRTTIIYESPHQLIKLLKELSVLCGEDRSIQIFRELTKRYEESIGSTIKETIEFFKISKPKGEFTIVLGGNDTEKSCFSISKDEAIKKLESLTNQGHSSKDAAKNISEETGYSKKWLYSQLHKKLDK
tara:strand:+ start:1827 stop:2717 length:891 start_codon:yes stop_codon:yes gene_type:complete